MERVVAGKVAEGEGEEEEEAEADMEREWGWWRDVVVVVGRWREVGSGEQEVPRRSILREREREIGCGKLLASAVMV